jgi:hypothetical protein
MTTKPSHGRIPLELQAVFLASNRGEEVHTPPPGNIAFRMFQSIFQRGNNKSQPVTAPAPASAPTPKNIRGFFGMARNQMRRASTKDIIQDQSSKGPQARRASVTHAASVTDRTCPIRDISFECSSPTRSGKTKATYKTKIMPDDVSVASSVTFTVLHEVKKKTKKTKKEKVRNASLAHGSSLFKSIILSLLNMLHIYNFPTENTSIVLRYHDESSRIHQETLLCIGMWLSQQDHTDTTFELSHICR